MNGETPQNILVKFKKNCKEYTLKIYISVSCKPFKNPKSDGFLDTSDHQG